jgi:hypothetical protein
MWRVLRLDDNGNTYQVAKATTEDEARAIAAAFEARGHKQMYFVERDVSPTGSDSSDAPA